VAWPTRCCAKRLRLQSSQEDLGLPAVLLVPSNLRWLLSRFLRRAVPQLKVISNTEVPDSKIIKVTSLIGANK